MEKRYKPEEFNSDEMTRLTQDVVSKIGELLLESGKEANVEGYSEFTYANYSFVRPKSIGGIEIKDNEDVEVKLLLDQRKRKGEQFSELRASVQILRDGVESSLTTCSFNQNTIPRFHYRERIPPKRIFGIKANAEKLSELLDFLNEPLYLADG